MDGKTILQETRRKVAMLVSIHQKVQSRSFLLRKMPKAASIPKRLRTPWNWQNSQTSKRIWRQVVHQKRSVINHATCLYKVWAFNVVSLLNCTPSFEWYMARLEVKNGQIDTCYEKIELCAQNITTILSQLLTIWEGLCSCLERKNVYFDLVTSACLLPF